MSTFNLNLSNLFTATKEDLAAEQREMIEQQVLTHAKYQVAMGNSTIDGLKAKRSKEVNELKMGLAVEQSERKAEAQQMLRNSVSVGATAFNFNNLMTAVSAANTAADQATIDNAVKAVNDRYDKLIADAQAKIDLVTEVAQAFLGEDADLTADA